MNFEEDTMLKSFRPWLVVLCMGTAFGGLLGGCSFLNNSATSARIEGYVLRGNASEPVAQTQITAKSSKGTLFTTATDHSGRFELNVYPDTYELTLKKNDYAGSQVIGLPVTERSEIKIIQQPAFNPNWSVTPPKIALKGVNDGDEFSGPIAYNATVSGENDPNVIYAALGKTPGSGFLTAPRHAFFSTPTTGDQNLNPALFGARGFTTFEVVTYDKNNNRTHLIKSIRVVSANAMPAPLHVKAIAVTLGKKIDYLDKSIKIVRPASAPIEIQSAPTNSNIFVQVSWALIAKPGLTGYRVYRSFDKHNFTEAGTVSAAQVAFMDVSPRLAPSQTVYYRVVALTGLEEGGLSPVVETTPLAPFDVKLIEPRDEAIDVSRAPRFAWKPTLKVGAVQAYGVILFDTVQGEYSWWLTPDPPEFVMDRTDFTWNEDEKFSGTPWETLQPNRLYEWQVAYAVALDKREDPRAISIAIDKYTSKSKWPSFPTGTSATDNFSFTTGDKVSPELSK
jgi:hypothetical protein